MYGDFKVASWTKKKLFTIGFKGRERRALLWRKSVYEEWFLCTKIAQNKGMKIPKDFGDLQSVDFETWWRDERYGFELFCEPVMYPVNALDDVPSSIEENHLLLDINLNVDQDKLVDVVTRIIKKKQGKRVEYQSKAKFQPSKPQRNLKHDVLNERRKGWLLMDRGVKHRDIVVQLKLISPSIQPDTDLYETFMLSALRKLSRYKRSFNQSLKQVQAGTFP